MPEYRKTEYGSPQREWSHRNSRGGNLDRHGFRPYRKREPIAEGRVEFDRAPGEIDHGSYAHRLDVLRTAIRACNKWNYSYQDDGWV